MIDLFCQLVSGFRLQVLEPVAQQHLVFELRGGSERDPERPAQL
jgi:hypothetical protein